MKKGEREEKDQPKQTIAKMLDKNKKLAKSIDLEEQQELERREAYIEPQTRDLLRRLLQEEKEIVPIYMPGQGFVYYTNDPSSGNGKTQLSREFLENLAQLGILEKKFHDSVSVCPECDSTTITMHNRCPKCKSHNVEKTSLTEHISCGFIDQRDKYKQDICPKCGEKLVEGQYKNMGRWYQCQACNERFDYPELDVICRKCNADFSTKEAHVIEVPKFSLKVERKKEIRQNVASLENVRILLSNLGFTVQIPGIAIGQKSGMQHHFSLIGKKQIDENEITIALDHAVSETEVTTSPLILYIYKTSEIQVDIPIFIAMPKLNDTAKKIAQGHNILLIEGSTEEQEIIETIKTKIQERLTPRVQPKKTEQPEKQKTDVKPQTASLFSKLNLLKKKSTAQTEQQPKQLPVKEPPMRVKLNQTKTHQKKRSIQPALMALGKKAFRLSIIFNALLCIFYAIALLSGMYSNNWNLFEPHLINGNLFWLLIAAATINILYTLTTNQLTIIKTRTYSFLIGIIIFGVSVALLLTTTPYSITSLFTESITDLNINIGRFFLLSGLALFLLDIPNIKRTGRINQPKKNKINKLMSITHIILGSTTVYLFMAVSLSISQFPQTATTANLILIGALLFSSLISFGAAIYCLKLKAQPKIEVNIEQDPVTGHLIN
jgi:predicted RNA-binding Zn-ribbon protein involved in translation (DUF1610 family)